MDNVQTYFEVLKWASSFLEASGKDRNIAEYLLLEYHGWTKTHLLLNFKEHVPSEIKSRFEKDLQAVLNDYPPQYLIGSCMFYGLRFKVTPDTLIPRPETEELVFRCLTDNSSDHLRVVDVGTGTGAIAISLKKEKPNWDMVAIDISKEALDVAKENASSLNVDIDCLLGDTLEPISNQTVDLIVSNPPYIDIVEWDTMDESVRKFEPKSALFAEKKGLEIYQKIAKQAPSILSKSGKIYLEIGHLQGEAVSRIFQEAFPNKEVDIVKDIAGKDRIIIVHGGTDAYEH